MLTVLRLLQELSNLTVLRVLLGIVVNNKYIL